MCLKKITAMVAIGATLAFPAHAQSYEFHAKGKSLPMDEGVWSYEGDQFECKMTLPMKGMGHIDVVSSAGSSLFLGYYPFEKKDQTTAIAWSSAPWNEKANGHFYTLSDEETHFSLDTINTKNLMYSLDEGGWFLFMDGNRSIHVPTLGWSVYASNFRECVSNLLPLSKDQVRDQVIYYAMGQRVLTLEQLGKIRDIAKTVTSLSNVEKVLVDSYTDQTGSRLTNLQLSRERSADVVSALSSAGVDRDLIEQRSHGERYPSSREQSKQSQDLSRKVTIRVIRSNESSN